MTAIKEKYLAETDREEDISFYLNVATLYALNDQEDDAKDMLNRILQTDKENEVAKAMLLCYLNGRCICSPALAILVQKTLW
jgi:Tfp pilus assembly protein PilF